MLAVIPTPYILWPAWQQSWIFPAQLCWAIAWGFEWYLISRFSNDAPELSGSIIRVSHLEELCFWLFLTVREIARPDTNSY